MGRPTKMTDKTLGKLEQAFAVDATYEEASLFAEINPDTLYEYIKKNPEYSERIKTLKRMTGLKAKMNINNGIDEGDKPDSKWYLERRDPDFKPKKETDVTVNAHEDVVKMLIDRDKGKG